MDFLYEFGISQEDALTEFKALKLDSGDSVLCIAGAGEIPLNLAAIADVKILAADISVNQIRVCRIKQIAAISLDSVTASAFLGYMEMDGKSREIIYRSAIEPDLCTEDSKFWNDNLPTVRRGIINSGKFEIFLKRISFFLRFAIGKKELYELFECNTLDEQREIFNKRIEGPIVKGLFRLCFHPWIYTKIGINKAAMTHFGTKNLGKYFYERFRDFCCNTSSRKNYFLQYYFFNKVLFPEALPEFLQPSLHDSFIKNVVNLEYILSPINKLLLETEKGRFNKIHISNVSDWLSADKMCELIQLIRNKTFPGARTVLRYVYKNHMIQHSLPDFKADYETGKTLEFVDRNPFFSIVPLIRS